MLKRAFIFVLFALLATPVVAQEQDPTPYSHGLNFSPAAKLQFADVPSKTETLEEKTAREEKERLAACKRAKLPDNTPFSYYGYRHAEAHCKDWVKQLLDSVGEPCCSSPFTGECRVSQYDFAANMVEVDGMMSPVPKTVKRGVINGLEPTLVLVCASPKYRDAEGKWRPGTVYCIGRDAGL